MIIVRSIDNATYGVTFSGSIEYHVSKAQAYQLLGIELVDGTYDVSVELRAELRQIAYIPKDV